MTKKGLGVIILLFLSLFGGIFAGYMSSFRTEIPNEISAEDYGGPVTEESVKDPFILTPEPETEVSATDNEKYMLTLSDSRLFIYRILPDGSMEVIEEKTVNTSSLRRDDYSELFKGIVFDTVTQAREVMEDYVN